MNAHTTDDNTKRIRELNDAFRCNLRGGQLILTPGIVGREDSAEILLRVATFNEFDSNNDPHLEHDFGAFEQGSDTIFWKLDYYNLSMTAGSECPADPAVTTRVLTIMLAEEY